MYGALTAPNIETPSTALVPSSTDMVVMDNDTQGNSLAPMSPMDSLKAIFEEMRDGINTLVELAYTGAKADAADMKDDAIAGADADGGDLTDTTDSQGNEGGFSFPKLEKPGPKLGLALLLGGLATLMAFGDKLVPIIAPVLKFIKEKALPFAIDAAKKAFEGIKTVFMYLYDNVWPFIKDNIILNAVDFVKDSFQGIVDLFGDLKERFSVLFSDDATWWEKITAFLGIFGDIGQFFIDQFDRVTEFIANVFGVSFEPYDGLISYIVGKLGEGFKVVTDFFSGAGEFIYEGYKGVTGFIDDKVTAAFEGVGNFFSATGEFLLGAFNSITDWIADKLKVPFEFLTDLFSFPESPKEFATKLLDLILLPYNVAINFLRGIFGFGADEEGNVEPFSLGDFIVDTVTSVIDFIKNLFSFDLPSVGDVLKGAGDIMQTLLRAVLPSPGFLTFETPSVTLFGKKFGGGSISLNPIPDALYKAAGIDPDTGEDLVAKADGDTTLVTGASVDTQPVTDTIPPTNGTELSEGSKETGTGGTVVTTVNNTDASSTNNSTSNTTNTSTAGLAVTGKDSTALALANTGF